MPPRPASWAALTDGLDFPAVKASTVRNLMQERVDPVLWTLSRDSASYDSTQPTADRTVHIDQYMGNILADVTYAEYPVLGKAMAVGIALHEGQLGWWNVVLNALFCLSVIFACVSGATDENRVTKKGCRKRPVVLEVGQRRLRTICGSLCK